jgi:hypothetical protein
MLDIVSAPSVVRVICSAYLFSTCILLSLTTFGWWVVLRIEDRDLHLPHWFS